MPCHMDQPLAFNIAAVSCCISQEKRISLAPNLSKSVMLKREWAGSVDLAKFDSKKIRTIWSNSSVSFSQHIIKPNKPNTKLSKVRQTIWRVWRTVSKCIFRTSTGSCADQNRVPVGFPCSLIVTSVCMPVRFKKGLNILERVNIWPFMLVLVITIHHVSMPFVPGNEVNW